MCSSSLRLTSRQSTRPVSRTISRSMLDGIPPDSPGMMDLRYVREPAQCHPVNCARYAHSLIHAMQNRVVPSRGESHATKEHGKLAAGKKPRNGEDAHIMRKCGRKDRACDRSKHVHHPAVAAKGRHRILNTKRLLRRCAIAYRRHYERGLLHFSGTA